jgi:hypothetical protein
MIPKSTPQITLSRLLVHANRSWKAHQKGPLPGMFVFGVRGYYFRTMGDPNKNDRGIYDDALFVVGSDIFAAFNANADPSVFRKGVASLIPGWYPYRPGNHGISRSGGGYPAFRPATKGEALPVFRDGEAGRSKRDGVAINIHRGGYNTTSSEGCQTIHPAQWDAFHSLVHLAMKRSGLKQFWYGLVEGPIS